MGPWPTELADLDDNEVIERARHLQYRLRITPREHHANDDLIRAWGAVCRELNRRGITDVVTEGSAPGSVIFGQFSADQVSELAARERLHRLGVYDCDGPKVDTGTHWPA